MLPMVRGRFGPGTRSACSTYVHGYLTIIGQLLGLPLPKCEHTFPSWGFNDAELEVVRNDWWAEAQVPAVPAQYFVSPAVVGLVGGSKRNGNVSGSLLSAWKGQCSSFLTRLTAPPSPIQGLGEPTGPQAGRRENMVEVPRANVDPNIFGWMMQHSANWTCTY